MRVFIVWKTCTHAPHPMNNLPQSLATHLLCPFAMAFFSVAFLSPPVQGQSAITLSNSLVRVVNELEFRFLRTSPPSHLDGAGYESHFVLAPNSDPYPFVVDASDVAAANPAPLTFAWAYFEGNDSDGEFFPLAGPSTSSYYTNDAPYLDWNAARNLSLWVEHGPAFDRLWFGVVVLTPQSACDALVEYFRDGVSGGDRPGSRVRRRLLPVLQEAAARFGARESEAGKEQLRLLQRRLKISRHPLSRSQVVAVRAISQAIMDTAHD
jgi:hypothetical protein